MSNNLIFVKAYCGTTGQPFFIRYDKAADGVWVESYGIKDIPREDAGSYNPSSVVDIDVSEAREGPQYKCPWCGNKGYWRHGSDPNCQSITCWDYKSRSNLKCGKCGTVCNLGGGHIQKLDGSAGGGQ